MFLTYADITNDIFWSKKFLTFANGIPTQVSLQIQMMETVILTKDASGSLGGDIYSQA